MPRMRCRRNSSAKSVPLFCVSTSSGGACGAVICSADAERDISLPDVIYACGVRYVPCGNVQENSPAGESRIDSTSSTASGTPLRFASLRRCRCTLSAHRHVPLPHIKGKAFGCATFLPTDRRGGYHPPAATAKREDTIFPYGLYGVQGRRTRPLIPLGRCRNNP